MRAKHPRGRTAFDARTVIAASPAMTLRVSRGVQVLRDLVERRFKMFRERPIVAIGSRL